MNERKYIAVEGAIGAGKTSLAKMLATELNIDLHLDDSDNNRFLDLFYANKNQYRFQTELAFLIARFSKLKELSQIDIFSRGMITDYIFERNEIFAKVNLSETEFALYREIYSMLLHKKLPSPDLVIYLQSTTQKLFKNIIKRNIPRERAITTDYIDSINKGFSSFFYSNYPGNLLVINSDKIDFVNNRSDFNMLLGKIVSPIRGIEFFNPESMTSM